MRCHNCGESAQHEADVLPRGWLPYCCTCFDHNWKPQRLIAGQECGKELVEIPTLPNYVWRWKKPATEGA